MLYWCRWWPHIRIAGGLLIVAVMAWSTDGAVIIIRWIIARTVSFKACQSVTYILHLLKLLSNFLAHLKKKWKLSNNLILKSGHGEIQILPLLEYVSYHSCRLPVIIHVGNQNLQQVDKMYIQSVYFFIL